MGVSLFVAVVYIVVNFLVDVLYGVIDPRMPDLVSVRRAPVRLRSPGSARRSLGRGRRGASR